ncbi:hypothetical protein [Roseovarius aestuarii]|uniref:Trypsin n=2 Tax=Roseovarius aestuarii TaxID=475083 RepID=A0A1X7BW22_9RHOB|nr:hypothetical protein [Roseovarius aestuarii]SMC13715.1 hypothetical protein ROA7745_03574 [Roseovarius aestuarii]
MNSIPVPSWKEAESKISVEINGVYVQLKNAPDQFQRFVRPAVFSTDNEIWELQYHGSATMVRYGGRDMAITTAHQTGDGHAAPRAEKFVIVVKDEERRLTVPPRSVRNVMVDAGENTIAEDILFYEYDKQGGRKVADHLELTKVLWSDAIGLKVVYSFLIGFPSESVIIELDPSDETAIGEYKLRWIRQDLEPAERQPLDPGNRNIFIKHHQSSRRSVKPDGLSGSPVFSVVQDSGNDCHLRFDGIVTHAKGDRFAVYPSQMIREALDTIQDDGSVER